MMTIKLRLEMSRKNRNPSIKFDVEKLLDNNIAVEVSLEPTWGGGEQIDCDQLFTIYNKT